MHNYKVAQRALLGYSVTLNNLAAAIGFYTSHLACQNRIFAEQQMTGMHCQLLFGDSCFFKNRRDNSHLLRYTDIN